MFEDLIEILVGPWGVAGVLLLGTKTGRHAIRTLVKTGVNIGLGVTDAGADLFKKIETFEKELVAEAKEELKAEDATESVNKSQLSKTAKTEPSKVI